jgi:hypothetical protein
MPAREHLCPLNKRHMGNSSKRWLLAILFGTILLASAGDFACWGGAGITVEVENRTDQRVAVFDDSTEKGVMSPADSVSFPVQKFGGARTFTVEMLDGRILTSRTFTWDEILDKGSIKIVVED